MRPRRAAPTGRRDEGASLILALAVIVGVSMMVLALLGYVGSTFGTTTQTSERAKASTVASNALQSAVNAVRAGSYMNGAGQSCLYGTASDFAGSAGTVLDYPGPASIGDVRVTCQPDWTSAAGGGAVESGGAQSPLVGLMTVGTNAGEPGIGQTSNNTLWVRGPVQSASNISVSGSACPASPQPPGGTPCAELYQSNYSPAAVVTAVTGCSGQVYNASPAGKNCSAAPPVDTLATIAGLVPSSAGATVRSVPACSAGTGGVVTLRPGIYTDVTGLNTLTSSCTTKIVYFEPGVYFFDFRNGEPGQASGSTHVWSIAGPNVTVVGGTPNGWSSTAASKPTVSVPGMCRPPTTTGAGGTGVQFVFGGDSRLAVTAGKVELCGERFTDRPPMAIIGNPSDQGGGSATAVRNVGTSSSTSTPAFTGIAATDVTDGTGATATFNSGNGAQPTATMTLNGFVPATLPPSGSMLTAATLTVVSRVSSTGLGGFSSFQFTPTVNPGAAGQTVLPAQSLGTAPSASATAWDTPVVRDLRSALAGPVSAGTFTGLRVAVAATSTRQTTRSVAVDSVVLTMSWIGADGVRGQTTQINGVANCVGTAPYVPGSQNCALITTSGAQSSFNVLGTTYAPKAAVDVQLTNSSGQVFWWGLVARSARIQVTASSLSNQPVVDVPVDTTGNPLKARFAAYWCPAGGCSGAPPGSGWVLLGQASATFSDVASGGRTARVTSWRMVRD